MRPRTEHHSLTELNAERFPVADAVKAEASRPVPVYSDRVLTPEMADANAELLAREVKLRGRW